MVSWFQRALCQGTPPQQPLDRVLLILFECAGHANRLEKLISDRETCGHVACCVMVFRSNHVSQVRTAQ